MDTFIALVNNINQIIASKQLFPRVIIITITIILNLNT